MTPNKKGTRLKLQQDQKETLINPNRGGPNGDLSGVFGPRVHNVGGVDGHNVKHASPTVKHENCSKLNCISMPKRAGGQVL